MSARTIKTAVESVSDNHILILNWLKAGGLLLEIKVSAINRLCETV